MPAISLLGTDYASLDAWWDAESGNDYGGAGPILEVPAGLGAMMLSTPPCKPPLPGGHPAPKPQKTR